MLVVGPSAGFIRYVGGVLPALGESAVVFTTPGRLRHGVVATAVDRDGVARLKGDLVMVDVLRRAAADRQELPGAPIAIDLDDVTVEIDRATAAEARAALARPGCRTTRRGRRSATRSAACSSSRASSVWTRTWRTRPSSPTSCVSSAISRRSRRPARRR